MHPLCFTMYKHVANKECNIVVHSDFTVQYSSGKPANSMSNISDATLSSIFTAAATHA